MVIKHLHLHNSPAKPPKKTPFSKAWVYIKKRVQRGWKLWWGRGTRDFRDAGDSGNGPWNAENGEDVEDQGFNSDGESTFEIIREDTTEA